MLVLSRNRDQVIMLGDDIIITVVDIRGDKVRLGIVAPKEIPVHRKEIYDNIKREEREQKNPFVEGDRVIQVVGPCKEKRFRVNKVSALMCEVILLEGTNNQAEWSHYSNYVKDESNGH